MLTVKDVIDAYVAEVAVQLPRRQRNDVAFELRQGIEEGLQDRAGAAGRAVDAAMALEVVRAMGRPAEVAARYRAPRVVIDPADGSAFVEASVIGLALIWFAGALVAFSGDHPGGALGAFGQWWSQTVVASLWWPGALVAGFGLAAWMRRRWPEKHAWTPRPQDRSPGGRTALVLAIAAMALGLYVLLDPRWVLDFFWGGRAHPSAYAALTYTDAFRSRQAPLLFGLVALNLPMFFLALVRGRWSDKLRRVQMALGLVTCVVMAWVVFDGPVLVAEGGDRMFKFCVLLIVAVSLVDIGLKVHRQVRPAPR